MKTAPVTKQIINGISVSMEQPNGAARWSMRFTDPKAHKQRRVPTGCDQIGQAWQFAKEFFVNFKPGQSAKKLTVGKLVEDLIDYYHLKKMQEEVAAVSRWTLRLKDKFADVAFNDLEPSDINDYKRWAIGEAPTKDSSMQFRTWQPIPKPLAEASVDRDLGTLSAAYGLAIKRGTLKFGDRPYFEMFRPENTRKGFITQATYDALDAILQARGTEGLYLRGLLVVGYEIGDRRDEAQTLKVGQCDFKGEGTICLEVGETKNGEGRWAGMSQEMYDILWQCSDKKRDDDPLFTYADGSPVKDFRKAWWALCVEAGLGKCYCRDCGQDTAQSSSWCSACKSSNVGYDGLLYHDMRRSAISNMVDRGIDPRVAADISGHRTMATFNRYNIRSKKRLTEAARRNEEGKMRDREEAAKVEAKRQSRHSSVTLAVMPKVDVG